MRDALKSCFRSIATGLVVRRLVVFWAAMRLVGPDRALEGATESLARLPGVRGEYLRNAFLRHAIRRCDATATICYGCIFSKAGAIIEELVYVGPRCHLGLVHLERDVLLAAGVHIPSGGHLHGTDDPDTPIREQEGKATRVRIGAGTWVGSGAIVLADVGANCVIGAGSVVTKPIPDGTVAAGSPARVIRQR
ncbi:MAG TPA: acyltransferase [Vicinamibacterales bacterium]|jgi:virginiamycin A acetyltransferase|nr:acyltransferase [Vicinamibacterales bacterium]